MSKVLILGDGLLGSEIAKQTGWNYVSRKKNGVNFTDIFSYMRFLNGYDIIVNCIANTDTYSSKKEDHFAVNYKGVVDLCDWCVIQDKKLVHISTDYVYGRCSFLPTEEDVPMPCGNWYTVTKLMADGYIYVKGGKYLIVRTSFKKKPFPHKKAWTNLWGNFDYVDVIARLIIQLIVHDAHGVFNVGTEEKNMYQLALQTNPDVVPVEEWIHPSMPESVKMDTRKMRDFLSHHEKN